MENNNPLFAQAPRHTFKLYNNPVKMARSLKKLLKWVMALLAAHAETVVINAEGQGYEKQFTAEAGFFTVLVRPPGDWQEVAPVLLAFSLRDLYLVGYQDNTAGGIWKLYDDAYIIGSGADDPANAGFWQYMDFSGRYTTQMHGVQIGMPSMYFALQTINNPASEDTAIRIALGVYIIVISEALRFPKWKRCLVCQLRGFQSVSLVNQKDRFDKYFQHWSSICKRVRRGEAAFVPGDGFATFKAIVEYVLVLLSRPPADEL